MWKVNEVECAHEVEACHESPGQMGDVTTVFLLDVTQCNVCMSGHQDGDHSHAGEVTRGKCVNIENASGVDVTCTGFGMKIKMYF